jgi:tetratricopeptide (TPR) repeat protein
LTPSRQAIAINNIASLLINRGDLSEATKILEECRAFLPSYFMTYRNLAKAYSRNGDRWNAYVTLSNALTMCEPLPAEAYAERAKYATFSWTDCDTATKLHPRLSYPYRLRAAIYMDRRRDQEAINELSTVISLTCEASDAALRAMFFRDSGDLRSALRDTALAVVLSPGREEYRQTLLQLATSIVEQSNNEDSTTTSASDESKTSDLERKIHRLILHELFSACQAETNHGGAVEPTNTNTNNNNNNNDAVDRQPQRETHRESEESNSNSDVGGYDSGAVRCEQDDSGIYVSSLAQLTLSSSTCEQFWSGDGIYGRSARHSTAKGRF